EQFLIQFAPERWSAAERFGAFVGPPYRVDTHMRRGTGAVLAHPRKFDLLAELANACLGELQADQDQIARNGYSPALGGKRFAALAEAMIAELYSTLDGVRQVIFSAFREVRGVQNGSTEKLFVRAHLNQYGPDFPEEIRTVLAQSYSSWFPRLRLLRSENTHGDIGSCHLDPASGNVRYFHDGIRDGARCLVIENMTAYLNATARHVSELVSAVFDYLYRRLLPVEHETMCGVFRGRMYLRMVAAGPDLSSHSGRCMSINWFTREPGYECPRRADCGAFTRPMGEAEYKIRKPR
ncbi:MAG TPA: hypothetical protein VF389_08180, partial [Woeseiaceae bacterium]